MAYLSSADFWLALFQIILINILLSGDNAVVIALASRSLPPQHQKKAIIFGSAGAIIALAVLTFCAVFLLTLPYLKIVGAGLLLWVGIGLLKGDDDETELEGHSNLAAAIKTIIIADVVMSLDNVIGMAAAAKGNMLLLMIGLAVSTPVIIFGSTLILKLMNRFPIIILFGAGLLGWVAGEMAMSDPVLAHYAHDETLKTVVAALGAVIVIGVGKWLAGRSPAAAPEQAPRGGADQPAA